MVVAVVINTESLSVIARAAELRGLPSPLPRELESVACVCFSDVNDRVTAVGQRMNREVEQESSSKCKPLRSILS